MRHSRHFQPLHRLLFVAFPWKASICHLLEPRASVRRAQRYNRPSPAADGTCEEGWTASTQLPTMHTQQRLRKRSAAKKLPIYT